MSQLNILIVTSSFYPATIYGGPIFSVFHLCKALANLGHSVSVVSANPDGLKRLQVKTGEWLESYGNFRIKFYNDTVIGRFSFSMMLKLMFDIKRNQVVHSQDIMSTTNLWSTVYAILLGKPVIVSPRGKLSAWSLSQKSRGKRLWLHWTVRFFASRLYFHATSIEEANDVAKSIPNNRKTFVVPNIINIPELSADTTALSDKYNYPFILGMGRLHKKKGFDILIEAFSLLEDHQETKLIIAGSDEGELEYLTSLCKAGGLEDKVCITGEVSGDEKLFLLANAKVFALPSHSENFGMVYAESLALGTPIIASIHTPWKEAADAGCGYWINNTAVEFAEALREILNKGKEIYSDNCRQFAHRFSPEVVGARMAEVYAEIAK